MNAPKEFRNKVQLVRVAAVALGMGCCGDGNVGVVPCAGSSCAAQRLEHRATPVASNPGAEIYDAIEMILMTDVPELNPSWAKQLPFATLDVSAGISNEQLTADRDRKLVLFGVKDGASDVSLARIDDNGEVEDSVQISAPDGLHREGARPPVRILQHDCASATCGDRGEPSVKILWLESLPCTTKNCMAVETIIAARDIHAAPARFALNEGTIDEVSRDAHGAVYSLISGEQHSLTKLAADGKVSLWSQHDFWPAQLDLALRGVALDDGRFVVVAAPLPATYPQVAVSFVAPDGAVAPNPFMFPAAMRAFDVLPMKAHATLIAHLSGDLFVVRLPDSEHAKGAQFVREDYTALMPQASAADPSGNVYIGTRSGGRLTSKPTLCRAPASGGGSCVTLPVHVSPDSEEELRFDEIVARDGGEIFVHSGTYLLRLAFPP